MSVLLLMFFHNALPGQDEFIHHFFTMYTFNISNQIRKRHGSQKFFVYRPLNRLIDMIVY